MILRRVVKEHGDFETDRPGKTRLAAGDPDDQLPGRPLSAETATPGNLRRFDSIELMIAPQNERDRLLVAFDDQGFECLLRPSV